MAFKSEAQRKKFLEMVSEGKISQEVFDAMDAQTDRKRLLPRLEKKPKSSKKIKTIKVL
jgi:hypothetical protein